MHDRTFFRRSVFVRPAVVGAAENDSGHDFRLKDSGNLSFVKGTWIVANSKFVMRSESWNDFLPGGL